MSNEALLADLDDDQRRAVTCAPSATIVHAGAGSGKTRVLTHRIAWRIADGSADSSRVLAITFTREAAAEMRRRLRALGVTRHDRAGDSDQPTIGTFHSAAKAMPISRSNPECCVETWPASCLSCWYTVALLNWHLLASARRVN